MKYHIYHNYNKGQRPVPEAVGADYDGDHIYIVDVDDIHEFVKKHGSIQLRPPSDNFELWTIVITDKSGWFGQK